MRDRPTFMSVAVGINARTWRMAVPVTASVLSLCAALQAEESVPAQTKATSSPNSAVLETSGQKTNVPVTTALEVLRDECVSCHRPGKPKGGLRLTTPEGLKAGGDSGPVVVAGKAEESLLYAVLGKDGDPHMPPKKQLGEARVAAVKAWIESGAPWDAAVMNAPPRVEPVVLKPMPKTVQPSMALAFSPDGSSLAVSRGGRMELRDATQSRLPVRISFQAHIENIASISWAPDGGTVATGGFRGVRFWSPLDGSARGAVETDLVGEVNAIAWSGSGDVLWVGDSLPSRAGFVRRLSWPGLQWGHVWKAHEDSVYGMVLSADGKWLATAGADRFARRWDTANDSLAAAYEGHTNHVLSVVFDPLTPRLATSGADRELKVWDRESREQDAVLGDKKQVFSALSWAKDGSLLVAVTDRGYGSAFSAISKHTGAQSSETAKVQKLERVDAILLSVAVAPNGKTAVAGSADGRLFVWSLPDGKLQPLE